MSAAVAVVPKSLELHDAGPHVVSLPSLTPGIERDRKYLDSIRAKVCVSDGTSDTSELLLLLASLVYPIHRAESAAQALLADFGSIGAIFAAAKSQLLETQVTHRELWEVCQVVRVTMQTVLREPLSESVVFKNWKHLEDYLRVTLSHNTTENIRLLFLNSVNGLIKDELHSQGTVNEVIFYPRNVVKRVLELHASSMVIVHNHPSGRPKPSERDVENTALIARVLRDIGVVLHDHVIVAGRQCVSMRGLGLLKEFGV